MGNRSPQTREGSHTFTSDTASTAATGNVTSELRHDGNRSYTYDAFNQMNGVTVNGVVVGDFRTKPSTSAAIRSRPGAIRAKLCGCPKMSQIPAELRKRWFAFLLLPFFATGPVSAADTAAVIAKGEVECYQIDNARIVIGHSSAKTKFGMANFGHQIGVGKHTVISIRRYHDADASPDSGVFFKTTIELEEKPEVLDGMQFFDVPVVNSFHSEGNSAFVFKGAYDWSKNPLRKISIRRESDGIRINYSHDVLAKNAKSGKPILLNLKANCRLREIMVRDLSLWQGYPGTFDQSFYPPAPGVGDIRGR